MSFNVLVATTYEEAQAYAAQIQDLAPVCVGFDTETTVSSSRESKLVSVITFATPERAYIFQIGRIYTKRYTFPPRLEKVLMSDRIIKVGVATSLDVMLLCKSYNLLLTGLHGFVDIQYLTATLRIPESSLNDLCTRFLPGYEGKDVTGHTGDWDGQLDSRQIAYASSDALDSLRLYMAIMKIDPCPRPDSKLVEDSEQRIHSWIIIQLQESVSDRTFDSIVNQIVNSYGPWRNRWVESDRKLKAIATLESFISKELWNYDCLRRCFPHGSSNIVEEKKPVEEEKVSQEEIDKLYSDFLRGNVNNIKLQSAINKIANSYSGWAKRPIEVRKQWANMALLNLAEQQKIQIGNGIVMLL